MGHHSTTADGYRTIGPQVDYSGSRARREMLNAAKELFARRGVEAVTLADIAQAARVTELELKQNFGSKFKLLLAIFEDAWGAINPRVAEVIATSPDARRAMSSVLSTAAHILQKDRALAKLMLLESYRSQPETGRVVTSRGYGVFVQICTALVERGQKEGHFKTSFNPRVVTSLMLAVFQGMMRDALLAEETSSSNPYTMSQLTAVFEATIYSLKP